MIREEIRQFFEQLMEELEKLDEAHTIITRNRGFYGTTERKRGKIDSNELS